MRRLIGHDGPRLVAPTLYARLPSFFLRNKTFKNKTVAGESACDQGRNKCGGAGQGLDNQTRLDAGANQQKTRIADSWGARITGQGDVLGAGLDQLDQGLGMGVLVVHVVGTELGL